MRCRLSRCILSFGGVLALSVVVTSCVPLFSDGEFQTLKVTFKLDQALAKNAEKPLQTLVFPEAVKAGKRWIQLSGRLTPTGSSTLPKQIVVEAKVQRLQSGQVTQTLKFKLQIEGDGTFKGNKKIKKNLAANEMVSVTLQPSGGSIAKNTEITFCVDMVKAKTDLEGLPVCVEGNPVSDSSGDALASLSSIQSSIFTPTCALSGCHSSGSASAGLVLATGQSFGNLVNVPATGGAGLDRVEPGSPNSSYLVKKLRGDGDITGARMPLNGNPLSSSQLDLIIQWIEIGAPNN